MATPAPPGHRSTSLVLDPQLAAWVDAQAQRLRISKAGYVRLLIAQSMESSTTSNVRAG